MTESANATPATGAPAASAPAKRVDLILGTAGHIDHGKSTLIQALTGTDPDRLAEEKRRGITITLGFAQLALPDGRTMGVVDVPGHEGFVKQMIAGATGIDVALLVIAADDGVMPQTVEHVAVLQTLGIASCVVALTKTDAVDADWVDFMCSEVGDWLATTAYADAPIVPVSARTGEGLDQLLCAIQAACAKTTRATRGKQLRMPVDRAFQIKGAGTVVTGTLWSGTARPGDAVEILPGKTTARIRSVQMHNAATDGAPAGNRVAINLAGIKGDEISAGDFLAAPGLVEPTDRFNARLTYLNVAKTGKPLETGTRMHIAHGTREMLGRVLLCNGIESLKSGESALAQIRLDEPLAICSGDRFVVRTYSPVSVAGGGTVLLAHPRRSTDLTEEELAAHRAIEAGDMVAAAQLTVETACDPLTASEVAYRIGIEPTAAADLLAQAVEARKLCALAAGDAGGAASATSAASAADGAREAFFTTNRLVQRTSSAIEKQLIAFHAANPDERGIGKEELRQKVAPRMEAKRFDLLIGKAVEAGKAQFSDSFVSHPSSLGGALAAEEEAAERILGALAEQGMNPAPLADVVKNLGIANSLATRAVGKLEADGRVVRIDRSTCFAAETFNAHVDELRAYLQEHGAGTVADLKGPLGCSRKYAVPILEYLDAHGITARQGDARTLR